MLVQLLVPVASNGSMFDLPVYGASNVTVVSLQYHTTEAAANNQRVIQVQSDKLRFVNSPLIYLTFGSHFSANITYSSSYCPSIKNCLFDGKILLRVVDQATNATPASMTHLLITLDVEDVK